MCRSMMFILTSNARVVRGKLVSNRRYTVPVFSAPFTNRKKDSSMPEPVAFIELATNENVVIRVIPTSMKSVVRIVRLTVRW